MCIVSPNERSSRHSWRCARSAPAAVATPRFDGKFFFVAVLSTGISIAGPSARCASPRLLRFHYATWAGGCCRGGFSALLALPPRGGSGISRLDRHISRGAANFEIDQRGGVGHRIGEGSCDSSRHGFSSSQPSSRTTSWRLASCYRPNSATAFCEAAARRNKLACDGNRTGGWIRQRASASTKRSRRRIRSHSMQLRKRHARGSQEASEITLKLSYRPPYDWSDAVTFLSERAVLGLESVGAGGYARYHYAPQPATHS